MRNKFKIIHTIEYLMILDFYGQGTTLRSGVPFMNHIDEGLEMLRLWGASEEAQRAFCIHPIVQEQVNRSYLVSDLAGDIDPKVLQIAEEYAEKANVFLCKLETDYVCNIREVYDLVGKISTDVAYMLLADKKQNYKDFLKYHQNSHPRARRLDLYFRLCIKYLEELLAFRGMRVQEYSLWTI